MPNPDELKPGTQVVYIPAHANGDVRHADCEAGFIIKARPDNNDALCGYYRKGPGAGLRTTANGEWTGLEDLQFKTHRAQFVIDADLARIQRAMEWAHE